ncbi:hypothetical protein ABT282_07345 [Streptomyces sp. NPDC000927]|uniref:hypothetical protein n=1 Tax=Streptomyces sp. NPDC000927 TaxID=3154371 RepID=UPI00332FC158
MSKITGNEPKHWHDENGNHRMPDPRRFAKAQPVMSNGKPTREMSAGPSKATICSGDPDVKAYWDHLDAHDRLKVAPGRRDEDSDKVKALFDKLEHTQRQSETLAELIEACRLAGE